MRFCQLKFSDEDYALVEKASKLSSLKISPFLKSVAVREARQLLKENREDISSNG